MTRGWDGVGLTKHAKIVRSGDSGEAAHRGEESVPSIHGAKGARGNWDEQRGLIEIVNV